MTQDVEALYRADLRRYPRLSPDEIEPLLAACRTGDKEAKDTVLCSILGNICWYAARLQDKRTPFMELVSVGNAVLVEHFDEALHLPNPIGYLKKFAYGEIIDFCRRLNHTVTIPTGPGHKPLHMLYILDDFTADEFDIAEEVVQSCQDDHAPLYAALASLTSANALLLILRLFGLCEHEQESLTVIAGGDSTTQAYNRKRTMKQSVLKLLRCYLMEHHQQYTRAHTSNTPMKSKAEHYAETLTIPEVTRKKLEDAAQQLLAQGQQLSMNRLRILSGVHTSYALAFAQQLKRREGA